MACGTNHNLLLSVPLSSFASHPIENNSKNDPSTMVAQPEPICRPSLVHHGAAATSSLHGLLWVNLPCRSQCNGYEGERSCVVYASHGILNLCQEQRVATAIGSPISSSSSSEPVWSVRETLLSTYHNEAAIITSLCSIEDRTGTLVALAAGYSDGSVVVWFCIDGNDAAAAAAAAASTARWYEQPLSTPLTTPVTDIDGILIDNASVQLAMCSSTGSHLWQGHIPPSSLSLSSSSILNTSTVPIGTKDRDNTTVPLLQVPANVVRMAPINEASRRALLLVGTAASRHNKIYVYYLSASTDHNPAQSSSASSSPSSSLVPSPPTPQLVGSMRGHEAWLTSFAFWQSLDKPDVLWLASGSQDCRIRLWEFKDSTTNSAGMMDDGNDKTDDYDDYDDDEARLEVLHKDGTHTQVSLEALLYGHEESVTSVLWHPDPQRLYRQDRVLLSSSMDRTLLLWTCHTGVWTPLTRVGAAGGILGGSLGSSMLGFVGAAVEPTHGRCLVGHAYGGALHFWSLDDQDQIDQSGRGGPTDEAKDTEELAVQNVWKASPCVTGHFDGVVDCCWEASTGAYLLTASSDKTCRLWAPAHPCTIDNSGIDPIWVELARPQVHGYSLNTITSLSSTSHPHLMVSGADEKEIRVLDAPLRTTERFASLLPDNPAVERPERAYIPSLGLSNKASPDNENDTNQEYDDGDGVANTPELANHSRLPLERDLGVESLWPEVRKLYGHNTEIYRLASVVVIESITITDDEGNQQERRQEVGIVASSAKARDAVDASIRIWIAETGKCLQVLTGGHKSTVATLAFSSDGVWLASAGKDRRLCLWNRQQRPQAMTTETASPIEYVLAASVGSAHKRIVWSVHFCPTRPELLASGSRDGVVKIWRVGTGGGGDDDNESICRELWYVCMVMAVARLLW